MDTTAPGAPRTAAQLRPLRIACVTETWPPEVNGVATTVARAVRGLRQRGHAVQVLRVRQHDDAGGPDEVPLPGLPIPGYPGLRMGLPASRTLVRLWTRERPDVVHIATEGPLGWSAMQAARRLRLPLCSDFRTNFQVYSAHYGIGWLRAPIMAYLRGFHNRTHCTMVPTEALRRELQADGFKRLAVVARGVDTRLFTPQRRSEALRARWGVAPNELVVACVGRLAPEKNLGLVLKAFEAIRQVTPAARLLLVGDGPQRAALAQQCPDALFVGVRSGHDLAAHYASADLFLFPSLTETFGNVTIEAMASGLPVVAFDRAGAAQLIRPGVDGMLVPPDNERAFVSDAAQLACAPTLRRALGMQARHAALGHDWDSVLLRLEMMLRWASHQGARQPLALDTALGRAAL